MIAASTSSLQVWPYLFYVVLKRLNFACKERRTGEERRGQDKRGEEMCCGGDQPNNKVNLQRI
jgi:hypothetical protein